MIVISKKDNENNKAIMPTDDFAFKQIFGNIGNEEITKGLVSCIIGKKIKSISLDENPNLERERKDEKSSVVDVKVTLDSNVTCNLEMQMESSKDIEKRILFYWSRLYAKELHKGNDYNKLRKTIIILITQFEIKKLKEIPKFHTEWKIRKTESSNIVLTPDLEFHIIELPKVKKMDNKSLTEEQRKLKLWAKFLLNPDEMEEEEMVSKVDEDLRQAIIELGRLRMDDDEVDIAEKKVINLMYQKGREEEVYDNGLRKGKRDGRKQGRMEGKKEKQLEIAKKMLSKKLSIEEIIEITELSKEEIEELL